jgi:hypothetical protein
LDFPSYHGWSNVATTRNQNAQSYIRGNRLHGSNNRQRESNSSVQHQMPEMPNQVVLVGDQHIAQRMAQKPEISIPVPSVRLHWRRSTRTIIHRKVPSPDGYVLNPGPAKAPQENEGLGGIINMD